MSKFIIHFIGIALLYSFSYGQTYYELKGTIVDENNEPLAGADVFLYPVKIGAATDANGNFVIDNL